jgi:hypothetical protein
VQEKGEGGGGKGGGREKETGGGGACLQQRSLFFCSVNLVLLAETHGCHSFVPVPAHDKSLILKIVDLIGCEANFTAAGDPLALLHVRRHRLALTRKQVRPIT